MEKDIIIERLKEILVHKLDVNLSMEDIEVDAPLYEGGIGLDSISIVNLIGLTEEYFDFQFKDEEISTEVFSSLDSLSSFISTKKKPEE
mgnify:CR=1 FL=1|jgi:acyl carrier protein